VTWDGTQANGQLIASSLPVGFMAATMARASVTVAAKGV